MMLALFLDRLGVRSVLFNSAAATRWHPKGSTEGSRTMEHFRRLGIAGEIRKLGLPADHPTDVAYFTRFATHELARLRMPSAAEVARQIAAAPQPTRCRSRSTAPTRCMSNGSCSSTPRRRPNITMRFGWQVEDFAEDAAGVTLTRDPRARRRGETWRAQYLVGCDGGRSLRAPRARHQLSRRAGPGAALFRRPHVLHLCAGAQRSIATCLGHAAPGNIGRSTRKFVRPLICVNGDDEFLFRTQPREPDRPPEDEAVADAMRRCVGAEIELADHRARAVDGGHGAGGGEYSATGRVLLAGDAVHLFTPTGGFGMNTGIDDADNLAWKLAAMVQGWGGARLLAAMRASAMPIALRNTHAARQLTANIGETAVAPQIEEDASGEGAAARQAGAMLAGFGEQFASLGVQLGARYDGSPIVAGDGAPPADSFDSYTPSGVPGGRAPHVWLDGGRGQGNSLYDRLGTGFTLLRVGAPCAGRSGDRCRSGAPRHAAHGARYRKRAGARTLSARSGADPPRPIHRLARQPPASAPGRAVRASGRRLTFTKRVKTTPPARRLPSPFPALPAAGARALPPAAARAGSVPPESRSSIFGLSFATRLTAVETS